MRPELQNYLLKRHANGQQTVIFVEEAQAMPIATLEEIRLLSNLETNQDNFAWLVYGPIQNGFINSFCAHHQTVVAMGNALAQHPVGQ